MADKKPPSPKRGRAVSNLRDFVFGGKGLGSGAFLHIAMRGGEVVGAFLDRQGQFDLLDQRGTAHSGDGVNRRCCSG